MYICCCVLCFYCCSPVVVFVYRCFVFYGNNILIFGVKICIVIFFVCCIVFCCNNIYVCSVITMWCGIAIKMSSETEIFFLGTIDITLHKPFTCACPPYAYSNNNLVYGGFCVFIWSSGEYLLRPPYVLYSSRRELHRMTSWLGGSDGSGTYRC